MERASERRSRDAFHARNAGSREVKGRIAKERKMLLMTFRDYHTFCGRPSFSSLPSNYFLAKTVKGAGRRKKIHGEKSLLHVLM